MPIKAVMKGYYENFMLTTTAFLSALMNFT